MRHRTPPPDASRWRQRAPAAPRAGSVVSDAECSRKAAAAARPPRACARPAERSSSSATASSGPGVRVRSVPGSPIRVELGISGLGKRSMYAAGVHAGEPRRTPPTGPRDVESGLGSRDRPDRTPTAASRRRAPPQAVAPPARPEPGRRRARSQRPATVAATEQGGPPNRRWKVASIRLDSGPATVRPKPPASSAPVIPAAARSRPTGSRGSRRSARVSTCLIDPAVDHRGQEATGICRRPDPPPRWSGDLPTRRWVNASPDHADSFGAQPAGGEPQRLTRRVIEPLHIIDEAEQRSVVGHRRHQAQHRQADEEAIRWSTLPKSERHPHRIALRSWARAPAGRASVRTAGANRRRAAPSPTRRHPPAPPDIAA